MDWGSIDWQALQRELWRLVSAQESRLDKSLGGYAEAIIDALRTAGYVLDKEATQRIGDLMDMAEAMVREGIEAAVSAVAAVTMPGAARAVLRDEVVARAVTAAYVRRWPDGLRLSDRVWAWQGATRRGVSEALAQGVRLEGTVGSIQMDIQRAIEAAQGERFAIVTQPARDWAAELYDAARGSLKSPQGMTRWNEAIKRAVAAVDSLQDGGTRRQAQHALAKMREALAAGRQDILEEHLRWWIYDKQQYAIRRVVRTEMATASHRAVIDTTRGDPLITGYRWRLSASHPVADICDVYAQVEMGMGAGVFPADKVPAGKAHPHCMCSLTPTTRRMRKDKVEGKYSEGDLVEQAKGGYQIYGEGDA